MQSVLSQSKKWFTDSSAASFWLKAVIAANLIALLSQVSIPMVPVPITGQTLAVTLIGLSLGMRGAVSAVFIYLAEGALGLPVFAGGGAGIAHLAGPTGGYLIGFLPSAALLGYFCDRGVLQSLGKTTAVSLLSALITMLAGLAQLSLFIPYDRLLQAGFWPFIPGGIIKAVIAGILLVPAYRFFSKI